MNRASFFVRYLRLKAYDFIDYKHKTCYHEDVGSIRKLNTAADRHAVHVMDRADRRLRRFGAEDRPVLRQMIRDTLPEVRVWKLSA
jgi:hypothetical protein